MPKTIQLLFAFRCSFECWVLSFKYVNCFIKNDRDEILLLMVSSLYYFICRWRNMFRFMFEWLVVMNWESILFVWDSFSIWCKRYLFINLKPSLFIFLKIQTIFHKNHETSFLYLNIINVVFMCFKEKLRANSALKLGVERRKSWCFIESIQVSTIFVGDCL